MNLLHSETTNLIVKAYYNVYNKLGYGFLERVYENAMMIELDKLGLSVEKQKKINVYYDDDLVGEYFSDILVNEKIILELKAAKQITQKHNAQLLNYLKATNIEVGLLLNFGKKPSFKRQLFENKLK